MTNVARPRLSVADLERAVRFYDEVFGMDGIAREPRANAAFLGLPRSGNHHDLGLFGVGTADGPKIRGAIGLTTWPGNSTPSTNWSPPAKTSSTSGPTPAS